MHQTRLDSKLINKSISDFPDRGKWNVFELNKLDTNGTSINWATSEKIIPDKDGIYAFGLPEKRLQNRKYKIDLHGPSKKIIEFHFSTNDLPATKDNYIILYIGRTTDLQNRLKLHFRKTVSAPKTTSNLKWTNPCLSNSLA